MDTIHAPLNAFSLSRVSEHEFQSDGSVGENYDTVNYFMGYECVPHIRRTNQIGDEWSRNATCRGIKMN